VPTAAPQLSFSANPTSINQGECSTLQWNVQNVQGVWVYRQDLPYRNYPQVGQGSQQVCPPRTVTYEMRVLMRDGSVTVQQVTINVTPAAPTNPLTGTAWQAVNFNNGQNAVVSPIADTNLTLRFESASQISGNGGCNTFNGDYSVSGSNIWIGAPATTQMLCAEDVAAQESQYLAALQSASTFRIDGNRLELRTAGDAIAAIFTRQ
jgi:heat shock protein HslJ